MLKDWAFKVLRQILHRHDNLGLRGLLGLRRMPTLPHRLDAPHPFDVAYGTDSSGFAPGETLATGSPADLYNTAYYAISPSTLREALRRIPGSLERFTFVDLGCGKGRALLVAAEFSFTAIVGVEIAPALAATARRNARGCGQIRILEEDAARMIYPETPLLVFLYHPFLKPQVRRALANLARQLRAAPRPAWVLYACPSYPDLLQESGFLREIWDMRLTLSAEDAAADRHGITAERYTLYRCAF